MSLPPVLQNLRIPVIGAPLFIISHPALVIAQCKAGIVGSFPALNARPASQLDEWLSEITETLDKHNQENPDNPAAPFAVNQIVHPTNVRWEEDLKTCEKYKVPIVITSLGARPELNDAVHSWGGITMHDIINNRFANKALEKGADGLIAVAAGAGGHAGKYSPFALIQEIREYFDGPLALSGSIANGGAVLAAQAMGADLAYIGSPFIATTEARAVDEYKEEIVKSGADDIVGSSLFTGDAGQCESNIRRWLIENDWLETIRAGHGCATDRWGNCDVEVSLSKPDELPYILGLVRQAFAKQMGKGESEA